MNRFEVFPRDDDFTRALADFDATLALSPAEKRTNWNYATLFRDAGQRAEDAGDEGLTVANDIFNSLCFGALSEGEAQPLGEEVAAIRRNFEASREPSEGLLPADGSAPSRWVHSVARLQTGHYDALGRLCLAIANPQLRARVADFLWITRQDYRAGNAAVAAYLEASRLERAKSWVDGVLFLQRALRIERELKSKNKVALQEAHSELQNNAGDPSFYSNHLMRSMRELRIGDALLCAPLAERAAQNAENAPDPEYRRAEAYWDLAIYWHGRNRNAAGKEVAQWALSNCYEKHAAFILARPGQNAPFSHAEHWIGYAVDTLRKIATDVALAKAEALHRQMIDYQRRARGEIQPSFHPVDFSQEMQEAQRRVQGLPFLEALGQFCLLHQPPSLHSLCRHSYAIARQAPFYSRAAKRQISFTGGTAAFEKRLADALQNKREKRRVRMIGQAHILQGLTARGSLLTGIRVLVSEHRMSEAAFLPLLEGCLFVPDGHEKFWARGLAAGARGEWMASSHLLVPQIEAGFRTLLLGFGATPPPEVVRSGREWGMQDFLFDSNCCKILTPVFGEALLYDARVLLCEKFGANLRPNLAHGLAPDGAFASQYTNYLIYLWWLALRLLIVVLSAQPALLSSQTDE
jgi:hypothetical protein